jgi:hypothetical protein
MNPNRVRACFKPTLKYVWLACKHARCNKDLRKLIAQVVHKQCWDADDRINRNSRYFNAQTTQEEEQVFKMLMTELQTVLAKTADLDVCARRRPQIQGPMTSRKRFDNSYIWDRYWVNLP